MGSRLRLISLFTAIAAVGASVFFIVQEIKRQQWKRHISEIMASATKEFNYDAFQEAAQNLTDCGEGIHDLLAPYDEITIDGKVYITDDQLLGRLMFFMIWRGKGNNMHAALHVTKEFDTKLLPSGYQGNRILNVNRPECVQTSNADRWRPEPWEKDLKLVPCLAPNWYLAVYDLD